MNEMHPTLDELVDYMHGELSTEDDAAIHAHLVECPSCAQKRDTEASLTDLLRAHADAEERELPPSVIAGIRSAIARPPRTAWSPLQMFGRPAAALAAAAAVAAVVYFGNSSWHGTPSSTRIDAAYYIDNHAALSATTPFSHDPPMPVMLTSDTADQRPVNETP